jgi:hypothetical protein
LSFFWGSGRVVYKVREEHTGDRQPPTRKGAGGEDADEEDEDGDHIEAVESAWQGVVAFPLRPYLSPLLCP